MYPLYAAIFLTLLATLEVIDAIIEDGWLEIAMSPNQPSNFYPDLMGSTDPFMNLLNHFHAIWEG